MVRDRSSEVAEISFTAATTWEVEVPKFDTTDSCWREVAAISVAVEVNCTLET